MRNECYRQFKNLVQQVKKMRPTSPDNLHHVTLMLKATRYVHSPRYTAKTLNASSVATRFLQYSPGTPFPRTNNTRQPQTVCARCARPPPPFHDTHTGKHSNDNRGGHRVRACTPESTQRRDTRNDGKTTMLPYGAFSARRDYRREGGRCQHGEETA